MLFGWQKKSYRTSGSPPCEHGSVYVSAACSNGHEDPRGDLHAAKGVKRTSEKPIVGVAYLEPIARLVRVGVISRIEAKESQVRILFEREHALVFEEDSGGGSSSSNMACSFLGLDRDVVGQRREASLVLSEGEVGQHHSSSGIVDASEGKTAVVDEGG